MPDVASVPVKETVSGWLYQPFASGDRSAAPCAAGGVLSTLKVFLTEMLVAPPPHVAEQLSVVRGVSALIVTASQPLDESGGGVITQLTVTLLLYQPLVPTVP